MPQKDSAKKAVRDIRRKTRRKFSAEEKIRIVLEGLRESRVRPCQPMRPKTTRTWGAFHRHLAPRAIGLCDSRHNGGGHSP